MLCKLKRNYVWFDLLLSLSVSKTHLYLLNVVFVVRFPMQAQDIVIMQDTRHCSYSKEDIVLSQKQDIVLMRKQDIVLHKMVSG